MMPMQKTQPVKEGKGKPFRAEKPEPDRVTSKKEPIILIVCKNEKLGERLSDALSGNAFASVAGDLDGAMQVLRGIHIDLVISDIDMRQDSDGMKLLRWVRGNRPETRFMLLDSLPGAPVDVDGFMRWEEGIDSMKRAVSGILRKPA
ncbi:MAG: response regulator [Candidatus Micrarchaeota archaeon]